MIPVASTEAILFDSRSKTFSLMAGNSLYAFSISPELLLEHLYWGSKLQSGYDLRYLSQSNRMTHFATAEVNDILSDQCVRDELFSDLKSESVEKLQETWRRSKNTKIHDLTDLKALNQKRKENLSWRLMSKLTQQQQQGILDGDLMNSKRRDHSMSDYHQEPSMDAIDEELSDEFSDLEVISSLDDGIITRETRSISQPAPFLRSLKKKWASSPNLSLEDIDTFDEDNISDSNISSSLPLSPGNFLSLEVPQSPISLLPSCSPRCKRKSYLFERQEGQMGKGSINMEYSDLGTGDFRIPSFAVFDTYNGSSISPLRYRRHQIFRGKIEMECFVPQIRNIDESNASTLVVTMADIGSGLEVDLIYLVLHNFDCIVRRVTFRNLDNRIISASSDCISQNMTKIIQRACSMTVDFEGNSSPYYLIQLSGSWARERNIVETKLTHGIQSFGSVRGVSGHQHNPFAAICIGSPNETFGEVQGFSLIYSGNFLFEAELSDVGRLRLNMGIHPMGFQWKLDPSDIFETPEVILVRSNDGLGGMSRELHRVLKSHVIAKCPVWAELSPPILLNTWEAEYFNISHSSVVEMAKVASQVGIDLIVLDDGWYGERNDDTTSLGDWTPNSSKFPKGLGILAKEVNLIGCRLGLWFEPEMVSEQSNLIKSHPNWYLRVPGRPRQIGRNQFVLDLSREEIRSHVFGCISKVLTGANIEYIKWDMNRPLTEVFSIRDNNYEDVWQPETCHRYVQGVYMLQYLITSSFPHILLENCASGGGRFDPGMLYFSPQVWCSDNTDAIARISIQYGTSMAYPASCIGAHVSSVPNHITGNTTRARTRGFVAMCGTFGYELDMSEISVKDRMIFKEQISTYRQIVHIIRNGEIYRLWDPFKTPLAAWMYVSIDKCSAVVVAFSKNSDHWNNIVPR